MQGHPLEDRVLVEPLEVAGESAGGIVIPETAKEKATRGVVLKVGPGRVLEGGDRAPMTLKAGMTVVYSPYAGEEMLLEGKRLLILRERDVFCWLEE